MKPRLQFRLRTLLIVTVLASIAAAIACRIAREERIKRTILGKWTFIYPGVPGRHRGCMRFQFGMVTMGLDMPNPPLDAVEGQYVFNTSDRTVKIILEGAAIGSESSIYFARFIDDDTMLVNAEGHPELTFRLTRSTVQ